MANPVIDIIGLSKTFGRNYALNSINMYIAAGAVHGFLGQNSTQKNNDVPHIVGHALC